MTEPVQRDDQKLHITLLQERAAGTFSRVYLAEARGGGGLSRIVAVKVIKEQWSESHEILTRTRDEARLLARLQHRNILRVEALAEVDGQPAIVMEFVDGIDLQQLIEHLSGEGRRIPRRAVYKIMADAVSAIAAAWEEVPLNGTGPLCVVHRDLKPSNIMVSKQGEVKVLDFGTARFDFTERQARTGALRFGSLKYMSPERRQGDRGEHPSDVYALGLVLIEMLRGELLPVLPLETDEHDDFLLGLTSRLTDLGLPDARWDDALRQTLQGMVAADPARRLHASQLAPLFRAFADSATGESLDAFCAGTVASIARGVYGGRPGGDLSGSRVFVAMSTSSDLPVPQQAPGPAPTPSPIPEDPAWGDGDQPTQVSVSITHEDRPTQFGDALEHEPPTLVDDMQPELRAEPHRPERSEPLPVTAAPASGAYPEADSVTRQSPAMSLPPHAVQAQPLIRQAPIQQAPIRQAPIRQAPPAAGGRSNLMVGLLAGLLVFLIGGLLLILVSAAGGAWWFYSHGGAAPSTPAPTAAAPAAAPAAVPDAALAAAAEGAGTVTIQVDDDMLQWTAIEDEQGSRLFKGSPGGSATLSPGDYRLLAKVRSRSTVGAPLHVGGDVALRCESADKGEVHCAVEGAAPLVLAP